MARTAPASLPGPGRLPALLICALLATVTLWRLGDTPPGLFIDEAAIALTARSLAEEGVDQVGSRWPLFPISFPDLERQMPINPVYTYASIPFALAGPGPWTARLPAVCWLWVAAAGCGLIAFRLTGRRDAGWIIASLAALSPWLFVLGRVGWEAVSFPAILSVAFWLLLKGAQEERGRLLALSGFLFGLAIYAYTTARLLAPATAMACWLPFAVRPGVRRHAVRFFGPLLLMGLPLLAQLAVNPRPITWRFESLSLGHRMEGAGPGAILARAARNHISYLSPEFLFLHGDGNLRHSTGRGVLLVTVAPLLALGLWQLWRRRREPEAQALAVALLLAPAGAAMLATQHPHAIRSIGGAVFWFGLAALGIKPLLEWTARRPRLRTILALAALLDAGLFLRDYLGPYRGRAYDAFDTGRVELLEEAFAIRGPRHLYVTLTAADDAGDGVLLAYLAGLPAGRWIRDGLDAHRIHRYSGDAPSGSLLLLRAGEDLPRGATLIRESLGPDGIRRYALCER